MDLPGLVSIKGINAIIATLGLREKLIQQT